MPDETDTKTEVKPTDKLTTPAAPMAVVQWMPETATDGWMLAKYFQASALIPKDLKNVADVFVTIAAGRDFGWSPMQAMRGIYVVKGKPSLSADAMVALAKGKPSICKYFVMVESTALVATYETHRVGDPKPTRMSFTIAQAKLAGLLNNETWTKYPDRMLRNRCKSALCKEVYEELFFGVYEEDEAREINERPEPPKSRAKATAQTTEPAPEPRREEAASQTVDAEIVPEATTTAAPPHDPTTGETADSPAPSVADKLVERIEAAKTTDELSALGKEIAGARAAQLITAAEREFIAGIYATRRKAILTSAKP